MDIGLLEMTCYEASIVIEMRMDLLFMLFGINPWASPLVGGKVRKFVDDIDNDLRQLAQIQLIIKGYDRWAEIRKGSEEEFQTYHELVRKIATSATRKHGFEGNFDILCHFAYYFTNILSKAGYNYDLENGIKRLETRIRTLHITFNEAIDSPSLIRALEN